MWPLRTWLWKRFNWTWRTTGLVTRSNKSKALPPPRTLHNWMINLRNNKLTTGTNAGVIASTVQYLIGCRLIKWPAEKSLIDFYVNYKRRCRCSLKVICNYRHQRATQSSTVMTFDSSVNHCGLPFTVPRYCWPAMPCPALPWLGVYHNSHTRA